MADTRQLGDALFVAACTCAIIAAWLSFDHVLALVFSVLFVACGLCLLAPRGRHG